MAEADKVIARLKFNPHTHTAAEIPAAVALYMARAQILATLATVPYDAVQSGVIDGLVAQQRARRTRERANEIMRKAKARKPDPLKQMRCGNCDGVLPNGCTCNTADMIANSDDGHHQ
jgi:RNase P subunit RPR2